MDIGVLTVVTAALVVLAIRALYQLWMRSGEVDGRRWRVGVAAALTVAAVACGYVEASFHHRQQLASEALADVSGVPDARANCARETEELLNLGTYDGYVFFDGKHVADLRRHICLDLASYASSSHENPTENQMIAVHVVAHEGMHIAGYTKESEAECRAVQLNYRVAEFLGATPEQARALQRRYFDDVYPRLRTDYRSAECREGGALDIFPDRTEFP
jgi:hypothetical protein